MFLDPIYKLLWAQVDFLNPTRVDALKKKYQSLDNAWIHFHEKEYLELGIQKRSVESLIKKRNQIDPEKLVQQFKKSNATLLYYEEDSFPAPLKNIPDPPIFLFQKGKIIPSDERSLAVVGARKPTSNGIKSLEHILPDICTMQVTIVSGMAGGIDTKAHNIALNHSGRTLAFWGTGIDITYPSSNLRLSEQIQEHGAIFSEFPLGTKPESYNFPRRNRLISGFAKGTLVIEGQEKSGSLITAHYALSQGKEVFAIPGDMFSPLSSGPNKLIRKSEAKLVTKPEHILEELGINMQVSKPQTIHQFENDIEEKIWNALIQGKISSDTIAQQTKIDIAQINSQITLMILKGMVEDFGNGVFGRK